MVSLEWPARPNAILKPNPVTRDDHNEAVKRTMDWPMGGIHWNPCSLPLNNSLDCYHHCKDVGIYIDPE